MATYYISTTGSDTTGDGSSGNPYASVSKCIEVSSNGDIIKALNGTYTISSTTNITKEVTITSNSNNKADVTFNSNTTIFNIQSSNVTVSQLTLQTSSTSELITIDRMSTGTTAPTFFSDTVITNCNIKYTGSALALNGTFAVTNNIFTRQSGTNVADLIKVYSCRGSSSVSSNTFTDSESVNYILYFTSTGSGSYSDICNSKGGSFTVASNNVTYTNGTQGTTFIYFDYFNQYVNATAVDYNLNTKLSLNVTNNTLTLTTKGKFIYLNTVSNSSYNMFKNCNINTNTINNTDYGVLHLGKSTNSTALTISSNDTSRSLFKIYSNILDTVPVVSYNIWDASVASSILNTNSVQANTGDNVLSWANINSGTLTTLSIGSVTKYVDAKNRPSIYKGYGAFLRIPGQYKSINCAMFFVYTRLGGANPYYLFSKRLHNQAAGFYITDNNSNIIFNQLLTNGTSGAKTISATTSSINIIGIQIIDNNPGTIIKYITAIGGGTLTTYTYSGSFSPNTDSLTNDFFTLGGMLSGHDATYKTIINVSPDTTYNEIRISDSILTDSQMTDLYNTLYNKWITSYP